MGAISVLAKRSDFSSTPPLNCPACVRVFPTLSATINWPEIMQHSVGHWAPLEFQGGVPDPPCPLQERRFTHDFGSDHGMKCLHLVSYTWGHVGLRRRFHALPTLQCRSRRHPM